MISVGNPPGVLCGQECDDDSCKCALHTSPVVTKNADTHFWQYISRNSHRFLSLNDIEFIDYDFPAHHFPLQEVDSLIFRDCTFRNCHFESHWGRVSLCFIGSRFFETQFCGFGIASQRIDFSNATFRSKSTVFDNCELRAESVMFENVEFDVVGSPFSNTVVRASVLNLNRAWFKSGDLRLVRIKPDIAANRNSSLYDPMQLLDQNERKSYLSFDVGTLSSKEIVLNDHFHLMEDHAGQGQVYDFYGTDFSTMKSAKFDRVDLRNAVFENSGIGDVDFVNCEWSEQRNRWILKGILKPVDQTKSNSGYTLASIQEARRIYVDLKRNYDDRRDFLASGDWFYREMECRSLEIDAAVNEEKKHKHDWIVRKLTRTAFWGYRRICDYGENIARPFSILVVTWVAFATLYFYHGHSLLDFPEFKYEFGWTISWRGVWDFVTRGLMTSFAVMALLLGRVVKFSVDWIVSLALLQIAITLIVLPLFLISLRRRFRR